MIINNDWDAEICNTISIFISLENTSYYTLNKRVNFKGKDLRAKNVLLNIYLRGTSNNLNFDYSSDYKSF